mmetsp:Transcript_25507/g.24391  ORF Transcript_25507/g.24391 Transcript_25507/m.24391 type:complete len:333 (-) Transcript_25507:222-1220(-)
MFEDAWGKTLFIDEVSAICSHGAGFSQEAIKATMDFLEGKKFRRKFVVVIADYEENIDKFLKIDAGLPRRFGYRINLPNWTVDVCVEALISTMKEEHKAIDLRLHKELIALLMADIVTELKFANGETVYSLLRAIFRQDSNVTLKSKTAGLRSVKSISLGFKEIKEGLRKSRDKSSSASSPHPHQQFGPAFEAASEARSKQEEETKKDTAPLKYQGAIDNINQMQKFKDRYNDNPRLLSKDIEDVNSEYNKELGKVLKISPEKALKVRMMVAKVIKEKQKKMTTTQVERFQYHCPFCGGVDSSYCNFIKSSNGLEDRKKHKEAMDRGCFDRD